MRKQTKIAVLVSAAALLAIGASMTSLAAWDQTDAGEWIFKDADGDRVYGEWRKSGDNWYYLDESTGVMAVNRLIEYNNEWYYVNADGVRVSNAWQEFTANDDIYLSFNQAFDEGDLTPSVVWYRFGDNGKALRAGDKDFDNKVVKEIDGRYYVFDEQGHMLSGWVDDIYKEDGSINYYYLGGEGEGWATTGWKQIFTTTQGDNGDGAPYESTSDTWFHFSDKGVMDVGGDAPKCVYIDGAYYYFNNRGQMLKDTKVAIATPPDASGMNAWVQSDGSTVINGWYETKDDDDNVIWYYLINKTVEEAGSTKKQTLRGVPFGMKANGEGDDEEYMGKLINGKKYLFRTSDGRMVTGKVVLAYGLNLVFDYNTAGRPITETFGMKEVGDWGIYFFNKESGSVNGQMLTGKVEYDEDDTTNTYYCKSDGAAYTSVIASGCLYDENGIRLEATDGNTYQLIDLTDEIKDGQKYMISTKKDETKYIGMNGAGVDGKYYVVVSSSGKIKQSASKMKVGDDYVEIKDYVVTAWK